MGKVGSFALVMVHGTFAEDAAWIQPESNFCKRLRKALPSARCVPFKWGGGNTTESRQAGAVDLARFLEQLPDAQDSERIVVIAHSHGGNVARAALSLSALPKSREAGLVTLNTPFLSSAQRRLGLLAIPFWFVLAPLFFASPFAGAIAAATAAEAIGFEGFGAVPLGMLLGGFAGSGILFGLSHWAANWMKSLRSQAESRRQVRFDLPVENPMLVVRVNTDEAWLWLKLLDYLCYPLHAVTLGSCAAILVAACVLQMMPLDTAGPLLAEMDGTILLATFLLIPVADFALSAARYAIRGRLLGWSKFYLGYGEYFFESVLYFVRCEATPGVSQKFDDFPYKASGTGFRVNHCTAYTSDAVICKLISWISEIEISPGNQARPPPTCTAPTCPIP